VIAPPHGSHPRAAENPPGARMVLGLSVRDLWRFALAGVVATVLFALLMTGVGLVSWATLPGCTGDSCTGIVQLSAVGLASPALLFVALATALAVLRTQRPLLVALVAAGLALLGLGSGFYLDAYQDWGPWQPVMLIALGAGIGPLATLASGSALHGRGPARFVLVVVVPLLAVAAVGVPLLVVTPLREQSWITAVVPQPYRYTGPGWVLNALHLNQSDWTLDLHYQGPGDQSVSIRETRPPSVEARQGRCAPRVSLFQASISACTAVPVTAPDLAMWRTASNDPLGEVVVLRAGALIQLASGTATTDAEAHALVSRLAPATAKELIGAAQDSYIPDPGTPPPAS